MLTEENGNIPGNERLHDKINFLQTELDLQKARADQLKKAYLNSNQQLETLKDLVDEVEESSKLALKDESESWQKITAAMKVK